MTRNKLRAAALTRSYTQSPKPLLLFAATPVSGHTAPLLPYATRLKEQGYDVFFIGGARFGRAIKRTGATFIELEDTWTAEMTATYSAIHGLYEALFWAIKRRFLDSTPSHTRTLRAVLEELHEKFPEREIIIVQDMAYAGAWPFLLGAPLPKGFGRFPKTVSFSITLLDVSTTEHRPIGPGVALAELIPAYEAMAPALVDLTAYANELWATLGATEKIVGSVIHAWYTGHTITVLPYSPSLEYPRADLSPRVRFIGATPRGKLDASTPLPAWWEDLVTNKESTEAKKVVLVTQGTAEANYDYLVVPTLQGLANRDDILVVALLAVEGATLDCDVPENSRVVDYFPYHGLLQYADVFVSNGGFGGFMQALMHGVPMVLAGVTGRPAGPIAI